MVVYITVCGPAIRTSEPLSLSPGHTSPSTSSFPPQQHITTHGQHSRALLVPKKVWF